MLTLFAEKHCRAAWSAPPGWSGSIVFCLHGGSRLTPCEPRIPRFVWDDSFSLTLQSQKRWPATALQKLVADGSGDGLDANRGPDDLVDAGDGKQVAIAAQVDLVCSAAIE